MTIDPFAHEAEQLLKAAGLTDARLVEARPETEHGYAEAVFHLGSLSIRFVLDRMQTFIDIGSVESPKNFHQFNDVECLMGWTTIEKVLDERFEPEPLASILDRLKANLKVLGEAFDREHYEATNDQLKRVRRMSGDIRIERGNRLAALRAEIPLVDIADRLLRKAGLGMANFVDGTKHPDGPDAAEVVFRYGSLLLRFVQERGEAFLDVASVSTPRHFHQFNAVEVALGTRPLEQVLSQHQPVEELLRAVEQHLTELREAFSPTQSEATNARLDALAREHGDAFLRSLEAKK